MDEDKRAEIARLLREGRSLCVQAFFALSETYLARNCGFRLYSHARRRASGWSLHFK